jgi:hypothetical protein
MIIIRHTIELLGRNWICTFQLDPAAANPISPLQQEKLRQFGQMQVARGGTVTPATGDPVVLAEADVYLPGDFPFKQVFSLDDYDNAASLVTAWKTLMLSRIQAANLTFMANTAAPVEGSTTITDDA